MASTFDKFRVKYEYGGWSVKDICSKYLYYMDELEKYIEQEGWIQHEVPDEKNIEAVNSYYANHRRKLTVLTAQRALSTWSDLVDFEDAILSQAQEILKDVTNDIDGTVLARLTNIYKTLMSVREMYNEAVTVPAITDKDLKGLLEAGSTAGLKDLSKLLKERGIPIPEIAIEDIENGNN